jgi:electron transport complex protein RnfG
MSSRAELLRITVSMAVACALGAAVLGSLYVVTDRHRRAAELRTERSAIEELLGLDSSAVVLEIRQYFEPQRRTVVYWLLDGNDAAQQLVFSLDGRLQSRARSAASGAEGLMPLGRLFLAQHDGRLLGIVVEGSAKGYKNRIRFLVALTRDFEIAGVRVVEHEEDPGLGAEVARSTFAGQFVARPASDLPALEVTRDPMPEDWRAALVELQRVPTASWQPRHRELLDRERHRPIYAVTGATISSRALTNGVRATVDHFRRRWALLEPYLGVRT